jgi:desulfoferrodoxin (superoxide reductase-like protein)
MTEAHAPSNSIELFPRRVFFQGLGAVGALFVVPGCGSSTPAKAPLVNDATAPTPEASAAASTPPTITANAAWESEAKTLEGMGQGLYTAKDTKDQPGKEGNHVPKVMLSGDKVALSTTHPTEAPSEKKPKGHHITHHYLRDGTTGLIFAWKTFELKPGETAASEFTLPPGVTTFTAYQVCNIHWTWATEPQTKA